MSNRAPLANPQDEEYFEWLAQWVFDIQDEDPRRTYWCLLEALYLMSFTWYISNDDNRASDGKALREEYQDQASAGWTMFGPCSMLELIIGLSRRMTSMIGGNASEDVYILEMLQNCGLDIYTDDRWDDESYYEVERTVDALNNREYNGLGRGGLFPLRRSTGQDMRRAELWTQLCAYINERLGY